MDVVSAVYIRSVSQKILIIRDCISMKVITLHKIILLILAMLFITGCSSAEVEEDLTKSERIEIELEEFDGYEETPTDYVIPEPIAFCEYKGIYTFPLEGGSGSATIIGFKTYDEKSYCWAQSVSVRNNIKIIRSYYFNQVGNDVWAVLETNGQIQRTHYVNRVVVKS